MVDLSTSYGGVKLKNPLICASGPPTHTPEACLRAMQAGFSAVVLKTHGIEASELLLNTVGRPVYRMTDWRCLDLWKPIPPKPSDPRLGKKRGKKSPYYTLTLISPGVILSYFRGEKYIEYVNKTKDLLSDDALVIASIVAFTEKGWDEQCQLIKRTRADMVELNFGCPYVAAEKETFPGLIPGVPIGAQPEVVGKYTKFCTERLKIPVICKLPPQQANPLASALACQRGGASGITFSDSGLFPSLTIDTETGEVGWHPDYPTFSSSWGPWMVPYILGNVVNFKKNGIKIDISASGGSYDPADIIRFLMAGAGTVQPCRQVMVEGWEVAGEWLEYLKHWMERKGYKSIEEFKGIAVEKVITDYTKLPLEVPQIMGGPTPTKEIVLDEKKCIECGWCEACCSHLAITMVEGLPSFDRSKCEVCGLCETICPTKALVMKPK